MPISAAHAAAPAPAMTAAPDPGEIFMFNMVLIVILVALFYVLMIVPQQRRFKAHRDMLNALQKGDRVLTAAGFIGTVEKVVEGKDEVVIDLGETKVTVLRSTIQTKITDKK